MNGPGFLVLQSHPLSGLENGTTFLWSWISQKLQNPNYQTSHKSNSSQCSLGFNSSCYPLRHNALRHGIGKSTKLSLCLIMKYIKTYSTMAATFPATAVGCCPAIYLGRDANWRGPACLTNWETSMKINNWRFFFFNKFKTKGWRSLVGSAIIGPSRKFKAQFLNWSNWTWQAGNSKLVVVAKAQQKTWLLGLSLVWCWMLSFLLFAL